MTLRKYELTVLITGNDLSVHYVIQGSGYQMTCSLGSFCARDPRHTDMVTTAVTKGLTAI